MKGIVMEKDKENVIVMTNDGQFLEIRSPDKDIEIGQEIIVSRRKNTMIRRFVAAAAVMIMMITGSYGVYGYYNPYGYVNVDINPSIEISYNLYDKVIDLKGLNDDGERVVGEIKDFKNKPIDKVLNTIVDRAVEDEYIKPDKENTVLVTITEDGSKIDDDSIYKSIDSHIKDTSTSTEVIIIENDKRTNEKAKKHKRSPGKTALIKKAFKSNNDLKIKEISKKSVKEIMAIIKDNKKLDKKQMEKKGAKENKKEKKDKGNKKNIDEDKDKDKGKRKKKTINKNTNREKNSGRKNKEVKDKGNEKKNIKKEKKKQENNVKQKEDNRKEENSKKQKTKSNNGNKKINNDDNERRKDKQKNNKENDNNGNEKNKKNKGNKKK